VGGGARRRRTLKYHYSGRYLAHSIGWKRGPLGPHILEQTRVRKWGRAALGPSSSSRTGRLPPSGGRSGVGRRRGDHRGTHRLLASAAWIQVEDVVRWGVWLGRHICKKITQVS